VGSVSFFVAKTTEEIDVLSGMETLGEGVRTEKWSSVVIAPYKIRLFQFVHIHQVTPYSMQPSLSHFGHLLNPFLYLVFRHYRQPSKTATDLAESRVVSREVGVNALPADIQTVGRATLHGIADLTQECTVHICHGRPYNTLKTLGLEAHKHGGLRIW